MSKKRLTNEQVAEIRERLARGERQVDLAAEFGVDQSTISRWKTNSFRSVRIY